jgi:hypothetical protein
MSVVSMLDLDVSSIHFEPLDPAGGDLLGQDGLHRDRRQMRAWGGFRVTGRVRTARTACRAAHFSLVGTRISRPPRTGWCVSSGQK